MIVDDEEYAIDALLRQVEKTPFLNLVYATTNPVEAIEKLGSQKIDLVFLDMHMGELNGIDFLRAVQSKAQFILCTAHSNYGVESYEYGVVDYLLKPILYPRFLLAVQKAIEKIEQGKKTLLTEKTHLFVKTTRDSRYERINYDDIEYMESKKNYVCIYSKGQEYLTRMTMKELETTLPESRFIRVHLSFFVPVNNILTFQNSELTILKVKRKIPVSDSYRSIVFKTLDITR
jgi:two-component system, LytTR family, response regulator